MHFQTNPDVEIEPTGLCTHVLPVYYWSIEDLTLEKLYKTRKKEYTACPTYNNV